MSTKPIFVATHPRACSTAFERVFMTRRDALACVHEPFGDAFYYGRERLSDRFENDERAREESGFTESTFKTLFDSIEREGSEGKRVFIKDMAYYLVPPEGRPAQIAPSLGGKAKKGVGTNENDHLHASGLVNGVTNGVSTNGTDSNAPFPYNTEAEQGNPTVVPSEILGKFHFTFLIRHPRYSIPSYYRCTVPPLVALTGFQNFMPNEAGYRELRCLFDYLRSQHFIGPAVAGRQEIDESATRIKGDNHSGGVSITVIDADDLLDEPNRIVEAFCKEVGIEYSPDMLNWDTEEDHQQAKKTFEKWNGFHNDAIASSSLKPRTQAHKKKSKTAETENEEWREKYGPEAQKVIRACVDANVDDYLYLKSFCCGALKDPF